MFNSLKHLLGLSFHTVFVRLLLIAAVILAPMLITIGSLAWLYASAERRVIEARRADVAASAAFIIDRLVAERIGTLKGLAVILSKQPEDLAEFHRLAAIAAGRLDEAIVLLDRSGNQVVSTRVPYGEALPRLEDMSSIAPVFEKSEPYVTDIVTDTLTKKPLVFVSVPVAQGHDVRYGLSASISTEKLSSTLHEAGLPESWIAAIVDRSGRFVARSINPEIYIGREARPELREIARRGGSAGSFSNRTLEGVSVENSFQRSRYAGWTAVVAVPTSILNEALYTTRWIIAGSFALAIALAVGLAALLGRSIVSNVRALQRHAMALARGESVSWQPQSIVELNDVGNTLAEAGEILKQRDKARAELFQTSSLLHSIINLTPDLVYVKDADSKTLLTNPATLKLYGKSLEDVKGRRAIEWHPNPDEVSRIVANDRTVMERGESLQFVEPFTGAGGLRVFLSTKSPLRNEIGKVVGVVGVSTDITDREVRAQHVEFIMRELSHRSKNLLTIIQSIARQTAKRSGDISAFISSFDDRLQSLSALHDVLLRHNWEGAALDEIVHSQLHPFVNKDRVAVHGPKVFLKPDIAQIFAMVFHELATNATKYGALSSEQGRVDVHWEFNGADMAPDLFLKWSEFGGPPVTASRSEGFGSTVLKKIAAHVPRATIEYEFLREGVYWRLSAPLSALSQLHADKSQEI